MFIHSVQKWVVKSGHVPDADCDLAAKNGAVVAADIMQLLRAHRAINTCS